MAKKLLKYLLIPLAGLCLLLFIVLLTAPQFGAIPKGAYLDIVKNSPHYSQEREIFVNRRPDILDTMNVGARFWADPLGRETPNFLFNNNQTKPQGALPQMPNPNLVAFENSQEVVKFIWLGHSTILLSIDGKTILIDPIFSDHAAPFPIAAKRFQAPVIRLEDLPEIDHIIISHDHYDHLDMETIKHFRDRDISFLAPLGVGAHLRHWGVAASRITELDWWQEARIGSLRFAATPSQHFSGRIGIMHNNKTLWASWVIEGQAGAVFYSGDSGYDTHYRAIGERYGPFDLIFIENGQYNEAWRAVHNLPEEAVTAFQELGGTYLVPVHWGMFDLSVHNWYDPPNEITKLARANELKLITPRLGEVISLDNVTLYDQWWLEAIQ